MKLLLERGLPCMAFDQRVLRHLKALVARTARRSGVSRSAGNLPRRFSCGPAVGFIDRVEGAPLPVARVFGWFSGESLPPLSLATSHGRALAPMVASRTRRHDVAASTGGRLFSGFRLDFLLAPGEQPVALRLEGTDVYTFQLEPRYSTIEPHYGAFFTEERVMGRDSVYGSGPPTDVSEECKEFARVVAGQVLDFGCGNGDLLEFLRGGAVDAIGLELDEARIRHGLKSGARPHVVTYPGGTPLPFDAARFDWIVATEVIEHVHEIARYIPEFARLLRPAGKVLVTTPDITCVPSSFPINVVPWHLLEATHVNFFTPQSLIRLFAPAFALESTYCLGASRVNGFFVPGSVGAIFARR